MRFDTQPHPFYTGIDLHARTVHVCVLDYAGQCVCVTPAKGRLALTLVSCLVQPPAVTPE
jgi:hypothetical protein